MGKIPYSDYCELPRDTPSVIYVQLTGFWQTGEIIEVRWRVDLED